jgi:hypothetical protein
MTSTIAELYLRAPDLDAFRSAVRAAAGRFALAAGDMQALGEAYFERHPDRASDRDLEAVRLGYAVVRTAVVEVLVRDLEPEVREFFRESFRDAASAGVRTVALAAGDPAALARGLAAVETAFAAVRAEIESLPKGLIKERFIGGISHLSNVLFLIRMKASRPAPGPGEPRA